MSIYHCYYINLDHRTDRKESILVELDKIMSLCSLTMTRIPGIYRPDFGILGCCQSHIAALMAIIHSDTDDDSLHIIFEDDFQFTDSFSSNILCKIHDMMKNDNDMDVFCLAANILESNHVENIQIDGQMFALHRIQKSQAHSGYIIKKSFAPIILANYKESESMLIQSNFSNHPYCFDVYVQHLQNAWGWFSFLPKIGRQSAGYSDIQNSNVDHKC